MNDVVIETKLARLIAEVIYPIINSLEKTKKRMPKLYNPRKKLSVLWNTVQRLDEALEWVTNLPNN
jgi:hypothetical protein